MSRSNPEPDLRVIQLAISPKAGEALQYVISEMDGYVEDDDMARILDEIHAEIESQKSKPQPAKPKPGPDTDTEGVKRTRGTRRRRT